MSTPSTSSSAPAGGTNAAHGTHGRTTGHGQRKGGGHDAADQFANLLSMLSASDDNLSGLTIDTLDTGPMADPLDPASLAGSDDANLAAMMQWAELPALGSGKARADTAGAAHSALSLPAGGTPPDAASGRPALGQASDPLLQGMQRLDKPEHLDPAGLARIATTNDATQTAAADLSGADRSPPVEPSSSVPTPTASGAATATSPSVEATPVRAASTRTTAGVRGANPAASAPTGTQALQQSHHQSAQAERVQLRLDATDPTALRSTLSLDKRFADGGDERPAGPIGPNGANGVTVPLAPAAAASVAGAELAGQTGGDTSGQPDGSRDLQSQDTGSDTLTGDAADDMARAEERLDSFATPNLHKASLRVGESDGDAIDIRLSMNGQALDLGFRTDDPETRAALARHAQGNLSDLLQRNGIQLGDVSVGAQNGQDSASGHPSGNGASTASNGQGALGSAARAGRGTDSSADPAPRTSSPARTNDGSGLDLFI
ncbi:MAG: flagellar hook-length control protein FliK [Hydrogenophaga sp.]|nr:flagellar hook-length control protein FliK [Hydrogenophaga sp.]